MTPIITTMGASVGRGRRVKAPSVGMGSLWANEPIGFTERADPTFTTVASAPAGLIWFGISSAEGDTIVNEGPAAATSLKIKAAAGTGATGIAEINTGWFATANHTKLYQAAVFKLSAGWEHQVSGEKFFYSFADAASEYRPYQFTLYPATGSQFTMRCEFYNGGTSIRNANLVDTTYDADVWIQLETLSEFGTANGSDGTLKWWTSTWNGSAWTSPILNASHTNVKFGNGDNTATGKWKYGQWNFYYGGSGGTQPAADQYVFLNRLRFSSGA